MGLPSSLDGIVDSGCSRKEKLLRRELDGVERGEALGLIGAFAPSDGSKAPSFIAESRFNGPIRKLLEEALANLVTSGAEEGPTWRI